MGAELLLEFYCQQEWHYLMMPGMRKFRHLMIGGNKGMRIFPIFLACSMVLSGASVMAQEEFGSGVEEIQEDNTNGAEEFLADFQHGRFRIYCRR